MLENPIIEEIANARYKFYASNLEYPTKCYLGRKQYERLVKTIDLAYSEMMNTNEIKEPNKTTKTFWGIEVILKLNEDLLEFK